MARTKVREELLVDVGEQVREDLLISTPPALKMTPAPQMMGLAMSQAPAMAKMKMAAPALAEAAVMSGPLKAHDRLNMPKPPPEMVRAMAMKVLASLPDDDEIVFCMTHEWPGRVGEKWVNWADAPFWACSDYQVMQSVYEWMNSEYEAILDTIGYDEMGTIVAPPGDHSGHILGPTTEELCEAWDAVANDQEETIFLICVYTHTGIPVGHCEVSAGWLMGQLGIERAVILPTVVIARALNPEDLNAIRRGDEVYLPDYIVKEVHRASPDRSDYDTCYIEPN